MPTEKAITVDVDPLYPDRSGTATLSAVVDECAGTTVFLVTPDARAAAHFGLAAAGVIGGIVRLRGRWTVTAYRDRAHLFTDDGPVYLLPNADSRPRAVRALLRWWRWVECQTRDGVNPRHLNPFDESAKFRRNLVM